VAEIFELDKIKNLGFDVEELAPRVFKILNFVTSEELQELYIEASSYSQEEWEFRYLDEMRKNSREKFGRDDLDNLKAEGLLEITDNFADKNISMNNQELQNKMLQRSEKIFSLVPNLLSGDFSVFQRLYAGTELTSHFDQYSDKLVEYAAVLYINDDYSGGELFFPKLDLKVKPEPGSLILFPGTELYEHGVRPVKDGPVRYVIPVFIKSKHSDGSMAGWANFG
jgi:hypothetical protein